MRSFEVDRGLKSYRERSARYGMKHNCSLLRGTNSVRKQIIIEYGYYKSSIAEQKWKPPKRSGRWKLLTPNLVQCDIWLRTLKLDEYTITELLQNAAIELGPIAGIGNRVKVCRTVVAAQAWSNLKRSFLDFYKNVIRTPVLWRILTPNTKSNLQKKFSLVRILFQSYVQKRIIGLLYSFLRYDRK